MTFADLEAFQKVNKLQLRVGFEAAEQRWHASLYDDGLQSSKASWRSALKTPVAHASHSEWLGAVQGAINMWQRKRGGVS